MSTRGITEAQKAARIRNFNKMQLLGMITNLRRMIDSGLLTEFERLEIIKTREKLVNLTSSAYSTRSKAILAHYKKKSNTK